MKIKVRANGAIPTEAEAVKTTKAAKVPKRNSDAGLLAQGLRRVSFVVPIEPWDRFVAACDGRKINEIFLEWVVKVGDGSVKIG